MVQRRKETINAFQLFFDKCYTAEMKVLCHCAILLCRSKECDFLAATLTSNNIPDFNGYNTLEARMAGQSTKPKTHVFH